ncbi:MAG: beta-lactamase [Bacteroidetes bacterium]|nr:beta-lactamase [Bacteroidota bacterium]
MEHAICNHYYIIFVPATIGQLRLVQVPYRTLTTSISMQLGVHAVDSIDVLAFHDNNLYHFTEDENTAPHTTVRNATPMKILSRLLLASLLLPSGFCTAQPQRWVDSTLHSLSLEERVGQLFVVELVALFTHEEDRAYTYALEMINRYHVGSFILAGGTTIEIPVVTNRLQRASRVPLLINADLEAGAAHGATWRLSRGWTERLPKMIPGGGTRFVSQMAIGATGNPGYAHSMGLITAREARAMGIHWSNSPVADVNSNPDNPIINTRSYGEDPSLVAAMVEAYVRGANEGGLLSTLKHFPGHGDTREDSHMQLPVFPEGRERLDSLELVPFRAGIAAGAPAVMTSHIALPAIDSTRYPATLSRPILTGILRESLGFKGIIVTDGMRMQGITDRFGPAEAAVAALEAGADAILGIEDIDKGFHGVMEAVRSGRLTQGRIDSSVRRILSAKAWVGLDRNRTVDIDRLFRLVGDPQSARISQEISDRSVTLLHNSGNLLPLPGSTRLHVVTVSEEPSATLGIDLLEELGGFVESSDLVHVSNQTGAEVLDRLAALTGKNDVMLVGIYLSVEAWKGDRRFSEPVERFLANLDRMRLPVILVAFGDPYVLGKLPATAAVLTPYNGTFRGEWSIARAITGRIGISGRLPVTIPGRYARGEGIRLGSP